MKKYREDIYIYKSIWLENKILMSLTYKYINEKHAYPAWWLMEPANAFPEPQGRMPTGVFIACSQSERSISPLITCGEKTGIL